MKRRFLVAGSLVTLMLCLYGHPVRAGDSQPERRIPEGWPEQLGERRLYSCECGFVYARKESAANRIRRLLRAVAKDLKQDGATELRDGLILVMDSKEEPPVEITKLLEVKTEAEEKGAGPKEFLETIAEAKEEFEKRGIAMHALFCLTPIPIEPSTLRELIEEFPEDVRQHISWCVIVPTDRFLKTGMRTVIDGSREETDLAQWFPVRALMLLIEQEAVEKVARNRRTILYQLLLDTQEALSEEQKRKMVKAYTERLATNARSEADGDKERAKTECKLPSSLD